MALPSSEGQVVPELMTVEVLREFPHARDAFTQGLLIDGDTTFESTGQYGRSSLRRVDYRTGQVQKKVLVDPRYFAEGLAKVGDELIQLTWHAGRALVYDAKSLKQTRTHEYPGEGWGLCYDAPRNRLVMSDGSDLLIFRDPKTFERQGSVKVTRAGQSLRRLNELECVGDEVFANVWTDQHIARIDLSSGRVTAWIDASELFRRMQADASLDGSEDVLNGIARIPGGDTFLLTGKRWPKAFEVRFKPAPR